MTAIDLTVVIPTRDEEGNVEPIVAGLGEALAGVDAEIVFVDDSSDSTPGAILAEAARSTLPVRLVHRSPDQRWGGLGGAVCDGFAVARGDWVLVMDGDMQHPPQVAAEVYRAALNSGAEVVVASRYLDGGGVDGLAGVVRRAVSLASTGLAKAVFPLRLGGCSDPMSGFFAIRSDLAASLTLNPRGYKILLDILSRRRMRVAEVPFSFASRHSGRSKACLREGARFGAQLLSLRLGRPGRAAPALPAGSGAA